MAKGKETKSVPEAEVVETKPKQTEKKKRVLKAAPTLREQTTKNQAKATKKPPKLKRFFGSKLFAPFRAIGRFFRRIWMSKLFKPLRKLTHWLGLILVPRYFRNSWKELKLVVWPNFRTTWRLTFAVLLFAMCFGLFIAGLDAVLENIFRKVLL